jgi:hypothetical protein
VVNADQLRVQNRALKNHSRSRRKWSFKVSVPLGR